MESMIKIWRAGERYLIDAKGSRKKITPTVSQDGVPTPPFAHLLPLLTAC